MSKYKFSTLIWLLSLMAVPSSILLSDTPPTPCPSTLGADCSCDGKTKVVAVIKSSSGRCVPPLVNFPDMMPYITEDDVSTPQFTVTFTFDGYFNQAVTLSTDNGQFMLLQESGTGFLYFTAFSTVDPDGTYSGSPYPIPYGGAIIIWTPISGTDHAQMTQSRLLYLTISPDGTGGYNTAPIGTYSAYLLYTHTSF